MALTLPALEHRIRPHPLRNGRAVPVPVPGSHTRFTVDQYHGMIRAGILTTLDKVELINGWIVNKMPIYPPHREAVTNVYDQFKSRFGSDHLVISQNPITLAESEPEPDGSVSEPPRSKYRDRNPGPNEVLIVVEVADSSLLFDRTTKLEMYAQAGIPVYWIVNLIDRQIEVYTKPKGGKKPGYGKMVAYKPGEEVPVLVAGKKRGTIAVADVIP